MIGKRTDTVWRCRWSDPGALALIVKDKGVNSFQDKNGKELAQTCADTFFSTWALAAYRIPIGQKVLMPVLRVEWLDTDREHLDTGARLYATAGLNLDLNRYLRLLVDVSHYNVQPKTPFTHGAVLPPSDPLKYLSTDIRPFDVGWTAVIAQVQMKL